MAAHCLRFNANFAFLKRAAESGWLGTIRRTKPLSDHYGRDRGTPVDRYYIEQFLAAERAAIRGRVLEMMNRDYTVRDLYGYYLIFGKHLLQSGPRFRKLEDHRAPLDERSAGTLDFQRARGRDAGRAELSRDRQRATPNIDHFQFTLALRSVRRRSRHGMARTGV